VEHGPTEALFDHPREEHTQRYVSRAHGMNGPRAPQPSIRNQPPAFDNHKEETRTRMLRARRVVASSRGGHSHSPHGLGHRIGGGP